MRVRRPRTAPASLLLAAAVVGGSLTGCGDDASSGEASDPGSSTSPTGAPSVPFEIRVVDATDEEDLSSVDPALVEALEGLDCFGTVPPGAQPPAEPSVVCDRDGTKYVLAPAGVAGGVESAEVVEQSAQWGVVIQLDESAADALESLTGEVAGSETRLALVVDGQVLTAPQVAGVLTGGSLQVSGDFTQREADGIAARLSP